MLESPRDLDGPGGILHAEVTGEKMAFEHVSHLMADVPRQHGGGGDGDLPFTTGRKRPCKVGFFDVEDQRPHSRQGVTHGSGGERVRLGIIEQHGADFGGAVELSQPDSELVEESLRDGLRKGGTGGVGQPERVRVVRRRFFDHTFIGEGKTRKDRGIRITQQGMDG